MRFLPVAILVFSVCGCLTPRSDILESKPMDSYLYGYISSVLEKQFGLKPGDYKLSIHVHKAVLLLKNEAPADGRMQASLGDVEGLESIEIRLMQEPQDRPPPLKDRVNEGTQANTPGEGLPEGDEFRPLLADPKQPQFFSSLRHYEVRGAEEATIGAVGLGETFGLVSTRGDEAEEGLQISFAGAVFAQFNLSESSAPLINADYVLSAPLTFRRGVYSGRLRIYHQSSHLGDEFILDNDQVERTDLSYESIDLLLAQEIDAFRIYLGGEYLFHRSPSDLKPGGLHAGLEFRSPDEYRGAANVLGGLDLKSFQEHDWKVSASFKVGVEMGGHEPGVRRIRFMLEAYRGFSPHGQFYDSKMWYVGFGVYYGY